MLKILPSYVTTLLTTATLLVVSATSGFAVPSLSLVDTGTGDSAGRIQVRQESYSLDLFVDTAGLPVSGLQYYIEFYGDSLIYGSESVSVLNSPFTVDDLVIAPSPGASVGIDEESLEGTTLWFKSSDGDYAAFSSRVARYTFDTSSLAEGSYFFTVVGVEFTNAEEVVSSFAPNIFTLNVIAPVEVVGVPDSGGSFLLLALGVSALLGLHALHSPRFWATFR